MNNSKPYTEISRISLLAMAVAGILLSNNTYANDKADSESTSDDVERIVITSSRRVQSIQDEASAVVAVQPDDFTSKGLSDIGAILSYTPGVDFSSSGSKGFGSITARGIPQNSGMPVFGIYVDDTPLSTNSSWSGGGTVMFDAMLMDVERVEVIKGPQGTLYGATSIGGMMRYISRKPSMDETRASFKVDVSQTKGGDFSEIYSGRVSFPIITDKLGITISGFSQDLGGYVDQINSSTGDVTNKNVDDTDVYGVSIDTLYQATDNLDVRLKYIRQKTNFGIDSSVLLAGVDSDKALVGEYTNASDIGDIYIDYKIYSGTINYQTQWGTFTSTTSKVEYEYGGNQDYTTAYSSYADYYAGWESGTTTDVNFAQGAGSDKLVQELRFTSNRMDDIEWIAGLYYSDEDTFNDQTLLATPYFNLLTIQFPSGYKEKAAFGDATYYFNDQFDATVGWRHSESETSLDYDTSGILLGESTVAGDVYDNTNNTYLFSGRYRPSSELSLYTRIASGYRPASANLPVVDSNTGESLADPMIEPDEAWSYEIGAKSYNADYSYDVALWQVDWDNFQIYTSYNGTTTGGNAEHGLTAKGIEASFSLHPHKSFSLTANLNYTKSTLNGDEESVGGVKGEQSPNVPKWTGSLMANYNHDLVDGWYAVAGVGLRYTGSYMSAYSNSDSIDPVKVDSRAITDLSYMISHDNYTINFYMTNVFNTRALTYRSDTLYTDGSSYSIGLFERPRTIGVNFKYDY